MKKLVRGIIEFRQNVLPESREKFAKLALGQRPDTLFIACSDSRVAPNVFASTDPGDMFVVRNVGNLIPCCGTSGHSTADESEAAAIEFSILNLGVSHIIVCGHSDCGAMHALIKGRDQIAAPHLRAWLRHAEPSLAKLPLANEGLTPVNRLSQLNVLQQIEHLTSYPVVQERIASGRLKLHAWWFELSTGGVYSFSETAGTYILIDEAEAEKTLGEVIGQLAAPAEAPLTAPVLASLLQEATSAE